MKSYYVIHHSNGYLNVDGPLGEAELLRRITPGGIDPCTTYYGHRFQFLDALPKHMHFPNDALLVLRAEVVVPREKRVAIELEIPREGE